MKKFCITLLIMLITIFSSSIFAAANKELEDHIVVIVNQNIILQSELLNRINQIERRFKRQNPSQSTLPNLRGQVLDYLILETIQMQMAKQSGIRVNDNELNDALARIIEAKGSTLAKVQQQNHFEGLHYAEFREQIYREMILKRVQQQRIGARIQITQRGIENFLNSSVGQSQLAVEYQISHILIPLAEKPTNQELDKARTQIESIYSQIVNEGKNFHELAVNYSGGQNALNGGRLGWRPIGQLPSLLSERVVDLAVNEVSQPFQSVNGYHLILLTGKRGAGDRVIQQTEVRHILIKPNEVRSLVAAQDLIEEIYSQIRDGKDFAALAKLYSDDPGSARKGGDLGWVAGGSMVAAFEEVMEATEINEISAPFSTSFGWHILEVLGRRTQDVSENYRETQARNFLYQRKFEEELQSWLREIRQEAFIDIKN